MLLMAKDHSEHSKIKKAIPQEVPIADRLEKEMITLFYLVASHSQKTVRKAHRLCVAEKKAAPLMMEKSV